MNEPIYIDFGCQQEGLELEHRKSHAFMLSVLCKEDKEQLNRIEKLLNELLGKGETE